MTHTEKFKKLIKQTTGEKATVVTTNFMWKVARVLTYDEQMNLRQAASKEYNLICISVDKFNKVTYIYK